MVTAKQWLDQFHENPFIRLPLSVVVLSKIKNNDFINGPLKDALDESEAFLGGDWHQIASERARLGGCARRQN